MVLERIVGVPSAELAQRVKAQIDLAPGRDYVWPGNVRELEQCVRRILIKNDYTPIAPQSSSGLVGQLQADIDGQAITAKDLLAGYCLSIYQHHKTIEAVARITGLDRRTAKKHIDVGRHLFDTGNR